MGKLINLLFRASMVSLLLLVLAGAAMAVQPGLYHDPDQPGHGLAVFAAPDDYRVLTWYTYAPSFEIDAEGNTVATDPAQAWFVSENWQPGQWVALYRPLAFFRAQSFSLGDPVGSIRVTGRQSGVRVDYQIYDWPWRCEGDVLPGPAAPWCRWSVNLELLAAQ